MVRQSARVVNLGFGGLAGKHTDADQPVISQGSQETWRSSRRRHNRRDVVCTGEQGAYGEAPLAAYACHCLAERLFRVNSKWAGVELHDREGNSSPAEGRLVGIGITLRSVRAISWNEG